MSMAPRLLLVSLCLILASIAFFALSIVPRSMSALILICYLGAVSAGVWAYRASRGVDRAMPIVALLVACLMIAAELLGLNLA